MYPIYIGYNELRNIVSSKDFWPTLLFFEQFRPKIHSAFPSPLRFCLVTGWRLSLHWPRETRQHLHFDDEPSQPSFEVKSFQNFEFWWMKKASVICIHVLSALSCDPADTTKKWQKRNEIDLSWYALTRNKIIKSYNYKTTTYVSVL